MQQYIQSLNGMNGASVKAIGSITNAAGTFQRYAVAVKDSDESVKTFKMSVNTATGEVYQLDTGIKSISNTAQNAGQAFMSLGASVANSVKQIVGLASIGSMIRNALGEMQDMSDELVTYKKVTGATADEVARVRKEAYASAQKYGQSPSDFLGSVSTFARAGYKEQSAAMADLATKTMLVGDMSAEAATSFLITADAGYQLGGNIEALNAIIDKANIIDNNYATSLGKLADGFTIAAPLANTMGMSVDELMASLGTISAVTQRSGTETARALRALMLNIMGDTTTEIEDGVTATEESVGALQKVLQKYAKDALAAAKASGKVLNPLEAIAALNKAWRNNDLSDAELMQIVSGLGGKLRSNELMAIIQHFDMLGEMLEKLKTESGSADDEVSAMMDSWTAKAQNLKTAFVEITNNSIQEGMVKNLLDTATGFVKWTGSLENFVGVAGAGLKAISALNAGVKNLLNGQKFGGANKWTSIISGAIAGISLIKSVYENHFREMQQKAEEAVKTAQEQAKKAASVADIQKRYREIAADGIDEQAGELEELKTLQSQLNSLVGDQGTQIDLVNGKYDEMSKKLANLTAQQLQQAKIEADLAVTEAKNNYRKQGLGTDLFFIRNAGPFGEQNPWENARYGTLAVKEEVAKAVIDYVNENAKNLQATMKSDGPGGYAKLSFSFEKAEGVDGLDDLITELKGLQTFLGSTTGSNGETLGVMEPTLLSSVNYEVKDLVESGGELLKAQQAQIHVAAQLAVANSKIATTAFDSKEAFQKEFKALLENERALGDNTKKTEAYRKALEEAALSTAKFKEGVDGENALSGLGEDGNRAADGVDNATAAVTTLTDAINAAAEAKAKFDAMMATSEEDGMNGYLNAVQTLEEELKAKKYNSWAAHASYRMLLGDEAYESAGGSAAQLYKMYTTLAEGQKMSAQEAVRMLNTKYYDNGVEVEGAGFVKMLEKLGYQVTDAMGNISLAADVFSDANIAKLSKETGLSEDFLWSFAQVLDQYDINGHATKSLEKTSGESELSANSSAVTANTAALGALTAALDGAGLTGKKEKEKETKQSAFQKAAEGAAEEARKNILMHNPLAPKAKTMPTLRMTEEQEAAQRAIIQKKLEQNAAQSQQAAALETQIAQLQQEVASKGAQIASMTAEAEERASVMMAMNAELSAQDAEIASLTQEKADLQKKQADNELALIRQQQEADAAILALKEQLTSAQEALQEAQTRLNGPQPGPGPTATPGPAAASGEPERPDHGGSGGTFPLKGEVSEVDTSKVDGTPIKMEPDIKEPDIASGEVELPAKLDTGEADAQKEELEKDGEVTVIANADTDAAKSALDELTKDRTVTVNVVTVGEANPQYGIGGGSTYRKEALSKGNLLLKTFARGTDSHPGGLSLVNDGDGPELIVQDGRAFIAGGGKPALLSLEKGAKVFTAGETRQILDGGGVPAYAAGTNGKESSYNVKLTDGIGGVNTGINLGGLTDDPNKNKNKDKGNGGGGGKGNTSSDTGYSGASSGGGSAKSDDDPWEKLVEMVDYILNRVSKALDQQLEAIDKQISALQEARDAAKAQNELEDRQEAVAKAQKDLEEAMNQRTVRYLGDDGQWHWMADQGKVQSAQEALKDAQDSLQEYLDDQAYEKQVSDLEKEKDRLQAEFDKISDAWDEIQDAVNTPTGVLGEIISSVLASGTEQEKKGAGAVKGTLISSLMESIYGKNYQEALDAIAKATAGNPLMPGESDRKLSDLISSPAAGADGLTSGVLAHLTAASGTTAAQMAPGGAVNGYIGQQTNNYYSINGFSIGAQEAAQPLSVTMQRLSVYANGNYS
nr:MAG TPA: minor tail protein [Caudoviricetes sp.]